MFKPLGLCAALAVGISAAQCVCAANLNAPVTDTPTIGSEIARGLAAADTCSINNEEPIYISKCAFDTDSANRQQHSNFKPFELGLFFGTWRHQLVRIEVGRDLPDSMLAQQTATDAKSEAQSMFVLFRRLERELHVTDAEVIEACPFNAEGRTMMQKQISDWSENQSVD